METSNHSPEVKTETVLAKDLRIDDIVVDEFGTHEVTCIDCPEGMTTMGVTMHGEEDGGEFVYVQTESVTRWVR